MERRIRKFKRRYPKDNYGKEHKQTKNILNFRCKRYEPLESELRCEIIKRSPLSKKLKQFPKDIQYKIYVFTMKNFWKKDLINRQLKPIWCDYKKYLDNELKKCIIHNVHFLHLDFNTLPEYKKWIPGCQCNFCMNIHQKNKNEYEKILHNPNYFTKLIKCDDSIENYWNTLFLNYHDTSIRIFNPLKRYINTIYDQIKLSPHDSPIYFSDEVQ